MTRQLHLSHPPARLKHARLDNLALLPGSMLSSIERYQALANELPDGGVLIVVPADNPKQKAALLVVAKLLSEQGHQVRVVTAEELTRQKRYEQSRLLTDT